MLGGKWKGISSFHVISEVGVALFAPLQLEDMSGHKGWLDSRKCIDPMAKKRGGRESRKRLQIHNVNLLCIYSPSTIESEVWVILKIWKTFFVMLNIKSGIYNCAMS